MVLVPLTGLSLRGPPMDWRHSRGSEHVFWLEPSAQSESATLVHLPARALPPAPTAPTSLGREEALFI